MRFQPITQTVFQSKVKGKSLFDMTLGIFAAGAFSMSRFDFCRLQQKCASCRFAKSEGCPPLSRGIIWSTVAERGWGYFIDLSTGFPQMPQMSCEASMRFRFVWYCDHWPLNLSVRDRSSMTGGIKKNSPAFVRLEGMRKSTPGSNPECFALFVQFNYIISESAISATPV